MKAISVLLALITAAAAAIGSSDCSSVHVIVARASTEPVGTGMIGTIASAIQARVFGVDIESLDYPALLDPYVESQTQGVAALTSLVQNYAERCPYAKMILLGYSQGAHVIADVLCGASETGFPTTMPQDKFITDKIAAVVLMGDPSHVAGQPFDAGSSKTNGIFPRQDLAGCDAIEAKTISFCDRTDIFCDSGDNLEVHMADVAKYGVAAADFVVSLVNVA